MRRPPISPRTLEELEKMLLEGLKGKSIPWTPQLKSDICHMGREFLKTQNRRPTKRRTKIHLEQYSPAC
jgi:hypothetical protein